MGLTTRKKRQQKKRRSNKRINYGKVDQAILDSINSPNIWTPEKENAWLSELHNIPVCEIYSRFPPLRKPPSVRKRSSGTG